jgi:hypothetical protein
MPGPPIKPSAPVGLAQRGDGEVIHPGEGSIPILRELEPGCLKIVGTGFYISRYGLVVTAKHVVEALQETSSTLGPAVVAHLVGKDGLHWRDVKRAHLLKGADVAVLQVDNFMQEYPGNPLENLRCTLSLRMPQPGDSLITYAYPENGVLDVRSGGVPTITGDYFPGRFQRLTPPTDYPGLPFLSFESTIDLKGGASGGPVFDSDGRVVAINCRGFDFRGGEFEGQPLSWLVPIPYLLELKVDTFMVPAISWEHAQMPSHRVGKPATITQLVQYGHVLLTEAAAMGIGTKKGQSAASSEAQPDPDAS